MEVGLPDTDTSLERSSYSRRAFLSVAGASTLLATSAAQGENQSNPRALWSVSSNEFHFEWDFSTDQASIRSVKSSTPFWRGGLLPALFVQNPDKSRAYLKPVVDLASSVHGSSGGKLVLQFSSIAHGELEFKATSSGLEILSFQLTWLADPLPIVALYFGTAPLSAQEKSAAPVLDQTFWPNWESAGYTVPIAKGAPLQSAFRRWDLGNATLPLGSFGPSLGTPYAAAYPRPFYAAALGDDTGWVCAGAGGLLDGALCLEIRSSSACLSILYREDLWPGWKVMRRSWKSPLRLTWATNPWQAYQNYFSSFESVQPARAIALRPQWNSWGDFKRGIYRLREFAHWTKSVGAEIVGIDDRWESFVGSGEPNLQRFPQFEDDIRYIKSEGLQVGFWQPVGWVDRPNEAGLSSADLITGPDGIPRRTSWDATPHAQGHYCLDPSSARAVEFLRHRTVRLMQRYQPVLLKLDFGYGLPSPNAGVPRDPGLRGERYSFRLAEIIALAARSINPDVAIEYYSIHPLWRALVNVVALDDLGDAGRYEAEGHGQWTIWATLAGQGSSLMASSGYDWNADRDVILNSAVIGVPGAVLSRVMEDGSPVPAEYIQRRIALNRWYRRTTSWSPLWLNSFPGGSGADPQMRSLGRLETFNGEKRLTALTLRDKDKHLIPPQALKGMAWAGDWALIAQDNLEIFDSRRLACIPVGGETLEISRGIRPSRVLAVTRESEHEWPDWQWEQGRLFLRTRPTENTLIGFLVLTV